MNKSQGISYLVNIFNELCYQFHVFWNAPDYSVRRAYLYYQADSVLDGDLLGAWCDEARHWSRDDASAWYYRDITSEFRTEGERTIDTYFATQPSNVSNILVNVKYTFSNKSYNWVSHKGEDFAWPPRHREGMKFHLPITGAWASSDGVDKTMDIGGRLRRVAGPRGDFHGQDVKFKDIMKYDFPKVIIETMINTTVCDEDDSVLLLV